MELPVGTRVVGEDGLRGRVSEYVTADDGTPAVLVTRDDGATMRIPTALLVMQADGSAFVSLRSQDLSQAAESNARQQWVLPVIAEEVQVSKRIVERGRVRVRKLVHEQDEVVDEPLLQEQVEVTRVAINRHVDQAPQVRREGDTLIVPVLEEVLVVEKRLVLKEELHITRRQSTIHEPQTVTLRSEELVVERLSPFGTPADTTTDQTPS